MSQLIIALDTPIFSEAVDLIEQTIPYCKIYKIGWTFFFTQGIRGMYKLFARYPELKFMLDVKFYDTPDTLRQTLQQLMNCSSINWFTMHHNMQIIHMARQLIIQSGKQYNKKLIAITLLTSEYAETTDCVSGLATAAITRGADGVVCSGQEAQAIRSKIGNKLIICTGLRSDAEQRDNHVRVTTVAEAARLTHEINYWVVGRPIIAADDPGKVAHIISSAISH
jgi:orotidine-5'-phosphate decarboxylase